MKKKYCRYSVFHVPSSSYGFTLIELLVVISIIGVILAISIFAMGNARKTSRDTRRKADLEQMRSAFELYKADCNVYPASVPTPPDPLVGDNSTLVCPDSNIYISEWPADPIPSYSYGYVTIDGGVTYTLCASLEGDTSGSSTANS